jgi:membrane protease YdiL (CAAX protease family)
VTIALSWIVWGTVIAQQDGVLSFHIPQSLAFWLLAIGIPAVAYIFEGKAAVLDLVHRLLRWRVAPVWYAVAVLLPLGLALAAAIVSSLLGQDISPGSREPLGDALGYFVFGVLFFGLTEETAWRGYILPRLQTRMSTLTAAVVLGLLWGMWHTPLWFIAGEDQQAWPYVGFLAFAVAVSVLITWVFANTAGSVLLVAIFHAATDASLAYSGVLSSGTIAFWIAVIAFSVAAVIVADRSGWFAGRTRSAGRLSASR